MSGVWLAVALGFLALIGAGLVVLTRDVSRLAIGLGVFFLAVAGFFAYLGFGFLALAELFVYVGGVLVLVLFAIMLIHRQAPGAPSLESRHDLLAAVACVGIFGMLVMVLRDVTLTVGEGPTGPDALGRVLLGPLLPQFELVGALLLAALVAVVAIAGGERE